MKSRPAKAAIATPEDTALIKIKNDKSISRKHAKIMITSEAKFKLEDESKLSDKHSFYPDRFTFEILEYLLSFLILDKNH